MEKLEYNWETPFVLKPGTTKEQVKGLELDYEGWPDGWPDEIKDYMENREDQDPEENGRIFWDQAEKLGLSYIMLCEEAPYTFEFDLIFETSDHKEKDIERKIQEFEEVSKEDIEDRLKEFGVYSYVDGYTQYANEYQKTIDDNEKWIFGWYYDDEDDKYYMSPKVALPQREDYDITIWAYYPLS